MWARVRDFLADLKSNGDKRERRGAEKANKVKLTEAFAAYDPTGKGVLAKKEVANAFTRAGLSPALTDAEWDKLVGALDAWELFMLIRKINLQLKIKLFFPLFLDD